MRKIELTDGEMLQELVRISRELGRTPKGTEIRKHGAPCKDMYVRRFGSYPKACIMAGLKPVRIKKNQTDEELLRILIDLSVTLGRTPTSVDLLVGSETPHPSTYVKRFGGLRQAITKAGLPQNGWSSHSDEELLSWLQKLATVLNRTPLAEELAENGLPHYTTYGVRFGSYSDAVIKAGLDLGNYSNGTFRGVRTVASDGTTICNSLAELKITELFLRNGIPFRKEPQYPQSTLRADWEVGNKFVEYFGLRGKSFYDAKIERKRAICNKHNIKLIELYPENLSDIESIVSKIEAA